MWHSPPMEEFMRVQMDLVKCVQPMSASNGNYEIIVYVQSLRGHCRLNTLRCRKDSLAGFMFYSTVPQTIFYVTAFEYSE